MARDKERIENRNNLIISRFEKLSAVNKHWKTEYIIEVLSGEFFLSDRTIWNILKKQSNNQ